MSAARDPAAWTLAADVADIDRWRGEAGAPKARAAADVLLMPGMPDAMGSGVGDI
jgi:hypothetical protein